VNHRHACSSIRGFNVVYPGTQPHSAVDFGSRRAELKTEGWTLRAGGDLIKTRSPKFGGAWRTAFRASISRLF
jgi:hypothetical protein